MGQAVLPPGFRFHPTDQELVVYYLKRKACGGGGKFEDGIIDEIDLYKFEPWDLPGKSLLPTNDPEWYFFNARDKKYSHGSRTNRATKAGYWKATGKDRKVCCGSQLVGMKKTLVFYLGRAPHGERTDWIMHEFRLDEDYEKERKIVQAVVLCRVHKKSGAGPKNGEQYGAPVLDEELANASSTDVIVAGSGTRTWFGCDDAQQEQITSSTAPVSQTMEVLNSEEDLQDFLQSLLTCDEQNAGSETAAVNQHCLAPACNEGLNEEAWTSLAECLPVMEEESTIDQITEMSSSELLHYSSIETLQTVPSKLDLDVKGMDDLHDILHPSTEEAEILEDILQTLTNQNNEASSWDDSSIQYDRTYSEAFTYHSGVVGDDYLELADLEFPLDEPSAPCQTHGDQECPLSEEDTGIEIRPRGKWILGALPGQGTAARRVRLQKQGLHTPLVLTSESINSDGTLQQIENSRSADEHFVSDKVPVFTSGGLTNVLSIESQDAHLISRNQYDENSASDTFTGFGTAEYLSLKTKGMKFGRKVNTFGLRDVSNNKGAITWPYQAADVTSEDLPVNESFEYMVKNPSFLPSACVYDYDAAAKIDTSVMKASSQLQSFANTLSIGKSSHVPAASDNLDSKFTFSNGRKYACVEAPDMSLESLIDAISSFESQGASASFAVWERQMHALGSPVHIDGGVSVKTTVKQEAKMQQVFTADQNCARSANMLPGNVFSFEGSSPSTLLPETSSQSSSSSPIDAVYVLEAATGMPKASTSSSYGLGKSLLQCLKLLEKVPTSPASADEWPLYSAQCKFVCNKPLPSDLTLSPCSKPVTAGAAEAVLTRCCYKPEKEQSEDVLPAKCLELKSSGLSCRIKFGPQPCSEQLLELPENQRKHISSTFSKCKVTYAGDSLTAIVFTKVSGQLCNSFRKTFQIITFKGSTSALLIIFCLLWGFWWRLTKSALTTIFNQNCIFPVI